MQFNLSICVLFVLFSGLISANPPSISEHQQSISEHQQSIREHQQSISEHQQSPSELSVSKKLALSGVAGSCVRQSGFATSPKNDILHPSRPAPPPPNQAEPVLTKATTLSTSTDEYLVKSPTQHIKKCFDLGKIQQDPNSKEILKRISILGSPQLSKARSKSVSIPSANVDLSSGFSVVTRLVRSFKRKNKYV